MKIGFLVLLFAVAASGCFSSLKGVTDLAGKVEDAGFQTVSVHHNTMNGVDTLTIAALTPSEPAAAGDADAIAKIAWDTYTNDIDQLEVSLNGRAALAADKAELEQRFGARDSSLTADTKIEGGPSTGSRVLIGLIVLIVAGALIGGLIVVSNRQLSRGRMP